MREKSESLTVLGDSIYMLRQCGTMLTSHLGERLLVTDSVRSFLLQSLRVP